MWLGHAEPAPHLRGAYDSEDGFREIIASHGGVVPLVASCADTIGARIDAPERGAIGVIGARGNITRQFGAIYDGGRWLVRTARGFEPVTAPTLAIWRLQCRKSSPPRSFRS